MTAEPGASSERRPSLKRKALHEAASRQLLLEDLANS